MSSDMKTLKTILYQRYLSGVQYIRRLIELSLVILIVLFFLLLTFISVSFVQLLKLVRSITSRSLLKGSEKVLMEYLRRRMDLI